MNQRWLAYLCFAVIGGMTLLLFGLRLRPVWEPPKPKRETLIAKTEIPTVTFADPSLGPPTAQVTIVEFGDFPCGPCAVASDTARAIQRAYPSKVRLVWKYLPNDSAHPFATPAAVAAQCAHRQGKFWEYADGLFKRQTVLSEDQFNQTAHDIGLDTEAFKKCYGGKDTLALVKKDVEESMRLSITATPTLFINRDRVVGAPSVHELTVYVKKFLGP